MIPDLWGQNASESKHDKQDVLCDSKCTTTPQGQKAKQEAGQAKKDTGPDFTEPACGKKNVFVYCITGLVVHAHGQHTETLSWLFAGIWSIQYGLSMGTCKTKQQCIIAPEGACQLLKSSSAWQPLSSVAAAAPAGLPPNHPVCFLSSYSGPSGPSDTVPVPYQGMLLVYCAPSGGMTEVGAIEKCSETSNLAQTCTALHKRLLVVQMQERELATLP